MKKGGGSDDRAEDLKPIRLGGFVFKGRNNRHYGRIWGTIMAIEFVVEDGSGLTTSTAYVSVADFQQYWENKGTDYTATADATIQAWLNDATQYADMTYRWGGNIYSTTQALAVPRTGWWDVYGRDVSESVPTYLVNGICELAGKRQGTDPDTSASIGVSSKSYGPVSVSLKGNGTGISTRYPTAEKWFNLLQMERGMRAWPS